MEEINFLTLQLAKKYTDEHGGGGGGTSNYNDLSNQPQVNGNTLIGNKSASDLGLVAAVDGKGLSTNDYTDADKAIVGGVTAALAGKQASLTAGKYIDIDANNEISVDRVIPNESASYEIKTINTADPNIDTRIIKTVNGDVVWSQDYNYQTVRDNPVTIDGVFVLSYASNFWKYKLLVASDDHAAGYEQTWGWSQWIDYTEDFSMIDHSGEKLIIKSELDTAIGAIKDGQSIDSFADVETALSDKQATLTFDDTPTDNSNNPVKSNGIYDALALKQNATDNNLETTSKTVVGAVNELKSGLTNYEATTNAALALPDGTGKNIFPLSFAKLKAANALVLWVDNTYKFRGVTFTVTTNTSGYVTNINASGTALEGDDCVFPLSNANSPNPMEVGQYILSGCPATGGGTNTYRLRIGGVGSDNGSGLTFTVSAAGNKNPEIVVKAGYELPTGGVDFTPMIRPATITDPTYTPYIPSVESRIEAVESGITNLYNGYYRSNINASGEDKWFKIAEHTATVWNIDVATIAIGGGSIKRLTLRYDQTQATFNNSLTKIDSVVGATGRLAYKYSENKVEVFWKAQRYGINTYTVLSESGNTPVRFQTPVLTDYVDADMDYIESST